MKYCGNCNRYLDENKFGKNRAQKDGLQTQCKECRLKLKRQYYHDHPERARIETKRYRQKHPEKVAEYRKKYRKEHPKKVKAHSKANYVLEKIKPCEVCGSTKNVQKHHFDYHKPLDVHFLCASCHGFLHVVLTKIEKAPSDKKLVKALFGCRQ